MPEPSNMSANGRSLPAEDQPWHGTVVVGMGNLLMGDEGVGVRMLEALQRQQHDWPGIALHDLGTGGMRLLHTIAGKRRAMILDCAYMGELPGTLRQFSPEAVHSVKRLAGFSLHEGDLLQILQLSHWLGEAPAEILIFGIEPAAVSADLELSPTLAARLPEYVATVAAVLDNMESIKRA